MNEHKHGIMGVIEDISDNISHNHEKKIINKKNILRMRSLFDELDEDAKKSLGNMIDFLLNDEGIDGEIHYHDDPKMEEKLQKIREILLSLPGKSCLHICGLIRKKLETQEKLAEILSTQDIKYDKNTEEEIEELEEQEHHYK